MRDSRGCAIRLRRRPEGMPENYTEGGMRTVAVIVLVLLILLLALPLGMGMAMGCPLHASICSATLGICAAILGMVALLVGTVTVLISSESNPLPALLLVGSLDRPPRY